MTPEPPARDLCPKCESADISERFHVDRLAGSKGCSYGSHNTADGEHLHETCRNCGYDWTRPTAESDV